MRFKEESLIRWIEKHFGSSDSGVSPGDDAAVFKVKAKRNLLLKTDALVEGVHFWRDTSSPERWGWKVVMKNASDMAAMGGKPLAFMMAIGVPPRTPDSLIRGIYRGIGKACGETGCRLAGGDTTRSETLFLAGSMIGQLWGKPFLRSGAESGDWVFVSGPLGASYESGHHLNFKARLDAAEFLSRRYSVKAALDVSDGLAKDLREIARKSRVGFWIDGAAVPLRVPQRGIRAAFEDGEDFELLFCLSPAEGKKLLRDQAARRKGLKFYWIGKTTPASRGIQYTDLEGRLRPAPPVKCHHFEASVSGRRVR